MSYGMANLLDNSIRDKKEELKQQGENIKNMTISYDHFIFLRAFFPEDCGGDYPRYSYKNISLVVVNDIEFNKQNKDFLTTYNGIEVPLWNKKDF